MVFKIIIFQNRYVELETPLPPFMEKNILNFHFDYLIISLRMNRAPDQTIILGLHLFLDHRSFCSIDQKIFMTS